MQVTWYSWPRMVFSNGRTIKVNNSECREWKGIMRAARDLSAPEIISHLYDAVISNGTKQQDDLTAVLVKSN